MTTLQEQLRQLASDAEHLAMAASDRGLYTLADQLSRAAANARTAAHSLDISSEI